MGDKSKAILEIIKERKTIRRYKDKPIPEKIIRKIIEAGIWGPSVPSFISQSQPWKFVVIRNKEFKKEITKIIERKAKSCGAGVNILLSSAKNTIERAPVIILIYNTKRLEYLIKERFKVIYSHFVHLIKKAELSAISAAIQNMILVAESLGIGSCWLDTPLFCEKEINKLLGIKNEKLVAILTLGYPAEKGKRSKRKPLSETVKYIR